MKETVYLNDGDATFVNTFNKICWGEESDQQFTFRFNPPKGEKFVVMLLGTAPKKATDYDLEGALERLGFVRHQEAEWSGWACQYPGKMPRLYGDKQIAQLNCDRENGDRLMFLASAAPQPEQIVTDNSKALVDALKKAATAMWNSEANMDSDAADIEEVLADYHAALAKHGEASHD